MQLRFFSRLDGENLLLLSPSLFVTYARVSNSVRKLYRRYIIKEVTEIIYTTMSDYNQSIDLDIASDSAS